VKSRIADRIRNSNQVVSAPQEAGGFSLDRRESAFAGALGGISSKSRKPLASTDTGGRGFPFASQQGGSTVTPKHSTQHSEQELKTAKLKEGVEDQMVLDYIGIEENSFEKVKFDTIDGLHKEDHELHKKLNIMIRICAKKDGRPSRV